MTISERQNTDLNIKCLAAQAQLYSDAKKVLRIRHLVSGVAFTLLAFVGNILNSDYAIYLIMTSILIVVIDELVLNHRVTNLVEKAAAIQDEFDCSVLKMQKNTIKISNFKIKENIQEYSSKYAKLNKEHGLIRFRNWYSGIEGSDEKKARIICQRQNCWWNSTLQKKYIGTLKTRTAVAFCILLVIALFNDFSVGRFLSSVINPLLPIIVMTYRIVSSSNKSRKGLDNTYEKLSEFLDNCGNYSDEDMDKAMRVFQDIIYDCRISTPLVPDDLYEKYKEQFEDISTSANVDSLKEASDK